MKNSEDVSSYISRVQIIVNQLKHNGETLTDAKVVEKILRPLTDDFENVMHTIEESINFVEMTIDDLEGFLEAYEQRKKKEKYKFLEEALQTKMTTKEDKVMYAQHNQERGCSYGCSRDRDSGNNNKERGQMNQQNWHGRDHSRGIGDHSNRANVEC